MGRGKALQERVAPEVGELDRLAPAVEFVGDEPLPEGPRVDEAKLGPVVENDQDVGVIGQWRALLTAEVEQLAGHAQVDD